MDGWTDGWTVTRKEDGKGPGTLKEDIIISVVLNNGCPLSLLLYHTLYGLYVDEHGPHLDKIDRGSLCLFETWLSFFFMLIMLFYFLNQEQAYNNLSTSYMSFALLLALKPIYLKPRL